MDNLSIVVGSTWEQGFIRFGQFFKVFVQATPEFRRYPEDLENMFVKNEQGEMVPYSSFMQTQEAAGVERDQPLQPVSLRRRFKGTGSRLQQRSGDQGDRGGRRPRRCRTATTSAGKASPMTKRTRGTWRSSSS